VVMVSISMLFMVSVSAVMIEAIEMVVSSSGRLDSNDDSPGVHCPGIAQQYFHEVPRLCRKNMFPDLTKSSLRRSVIAVFNHCNVVRVTTRVSAVASALRNAVLLSSRPKAGASVPALYQIRPVA